MEDKNSKSMIAEIMNMKEHYFDPESGPEYKELSALICKHDKIIKQLLEDNAELLKHYEIVYNALEKYEAMNNEDHYIAGFKYGFKLAMEILQ